MTTEYKALEEAKAAAIREALLKIQDTPELQKPFIADPLGTLKELGVDTTGLVFTPYKGTTSGKVEPVTGDVTLNRNLSVYCSRLGFDICGDVGDAP